MQKMFLTNDKISFKFAYNVDTHVHSEP